MRFLLLTVLVIAWNHSQAQRYQKIELVNGSFEGIPAAGANFAGWTDCARIVFPNESPPDIQPFPGQTWSVEYEPTHGQTYMGMVARDDETWEFVSQRLASSLQQGKCYALSMDLMQASVYRSQSRVQKGKTINYNGPLKIRVWGGIGYCQKKELLAESPLIDHEDWKTYDFKLEPKSTLGSITLEAFYKTPTLIPYAGNILVDNVSHIQEIPCDGEPIPEVTPPAEEPIVSIIEPEPESQIVIIQPTPNVLPIPRKKIIAGLTKNNLVVGQKILVEQLYFMADSSAIGPGSFAALDELYEFLEDNDNVSIEVGGHTNGIPPDVTCDKLSTNRARNVAKYLTGKGISEERVAYKGYGKRQRIASDRTTYGRARNQRVEIKILSLGA